MSLLFVSEEDPAEEWRAALQALLPDLAFRVWPEPGDPADIEVALVWRPPPGLLAGLPRLKAILSLGAGVDGLLADPALPNVPVARMVDPSLSQMMSDYVLLATLRHHRQFDLFERAQRTTSWKFIWPRASAQRRIGVMGLGELGAAAARRLKDNGFAVAGWSRTAKSIQDVECFAGPAGLSPFLQRTEILVCLLPMTPATRGILNAALFDQLPRGSYMINVGRGGHLVEQDLLNALDRGQLGGATLDVVEHEPLPQDSPLWRHPHLLITPHVASYCQPSTAAAGVAENIRRALAGRPLLHEVNRAEGY